MIELLPDECRVLGVLIEKALTTPEQYPLSLNATVNGVNQKNNRWPVQAIDEDRTLDALQGLRGHGLVVQVDQVGSRVHKYRHEAGAKLNLNPRELAVMAELLLRGPQTLGELRGRASRMHPLESLDMVKNILHELMARAEPLVRQVSPEPGSRAERFAQLLCPDLHPLDAPVPAEGATATPAGESITQRVTRLEAEVATLRQALQRLAQAVGEPDPLAGAAADEV